MPPATANAAPISAAAIEISNGPAELVGEMVAVLEDGGMEDGRERVDGVVVSELLVPVTVVVVDTVVMSGGFDGEDVVGLSRDEGEPVSVVLSTLGAFNVWFVSVLGVTAAGTPVSAGSATVIDDASRDAVSVATPVPVVTTWLPLTVYVVVPLSSVNSA